MLDGTYRNPTTVYFGREVELNVGQVVKEYADKVLLHYGQGSIKKYGLYDRVTKSLCDAGVEYVELGGVSPNPRSDVVHDGIDACIWEEINFILAVGGGSVIDSAKAISVGVPYMGDIIDLFNKKSIPKKALKVGVILTVPGAGSETSSSTNITFSGKKLDLSNPLLFPVFAMLNPELSMTVPPYQTSCGIVDAISHVLARLCSKTPDTKCGKSICEGLLDVLMKYALVVRDDPKNYGIRAEIMWACKLAQDNTIGFGRKQDWSCHKISHAIGNRYDLPHGAILAVIVPAWVQYVDGIDAARGFIHVFQELKMPRTLRDLGFKDKSQFNEISLECVADMPSGTIGNYRRLAPKDIETILEMCF
jgi:alcohol dehydrogenase